MRDPHIRSILKQTQLARYINDAHSIVVEELKLPVAKAIVDIAVINGHLHGYEIKSASDTLLRLPSQLDAYSKVFDFVTIITEQKYHERILEIIPDWTGLSVVSEEPGQPIIRTIRSSRQNRLKDGFYIAKLLWNAELIDILVEQNIPFRKKDRSWVLCELLASKIELQLLSEIVREKLKRRQNWKNNFTEGCEEE